MNIHFKLRFTTSFQKKNHEFAFLTSQARHSKFRYLHNNYITITQYLLYKFIVN